MTWTKPVFAFVTFCPSTKFCGGFGVVKNSGYCLWQCVPVQVRIYSYAIFALLYSFKKYLNGSSSSFIIMVRRGMVTFMSCFPSELSCSLQELRAFSPV